MFCWCFRFILYLLRKRVISTGLIGTNYIGPLDSAAKLFVYLNALLLSSIRLTRLDIDVNNDEVEEQWQFLYTLIWSKTAYKSENNSIRHKRFSSLKYHLNSKNQILDTRFAGFRELCTILRVVSPLFTIDSLAILQSEEAVKKSMIIFNILLQFTWEHKLSYKHWTAIFVLLVI